MLTIRQLAKQTGVPSKTLRYWESMKLLPEPSRNYNRYRLYQTEVVQRVTFIRKAKSVGFTLAEISACMKKWSTITTMPMPITINMNMNFPMKSWNRTIDTFRPPMIIRTSRSFTIGEHWQYASAHLY